MGWNRDGRERATPPFLLVILDEEQMLVAKCRRHDLNSELSLGKLRDVYADRIWTLPLLLFTSCRLLGSPIGIFLH